MDYASALEELKRAAAAPDILDEVAAGASRVGDWRTWTFDRQVWYLRRHFGLTQASMREIRCWLTPERRDNSAWGDVKLSTLRTLWRALGFEPLVVPDTLDLIRRPRPYRKQRTMSSTTSSTSARK